MRHVFANVRLIDGVGDAARNDVDVVVDGEGITAVVPHGTAWPEAGAAARDSAAPGGGAPVIIEGAGATLLPGLIDAHAHYTFDLTEGSIATIARRGGYPADPFEREVNRCSIQKPGTPTRL